MYCACSLSFGGYHLNGMTTGLELSRLGAHNSRPRQSHQGLLRCDDLVVERLDLGWKGGGYGLLGLGREGRLIGSHELHALRLEIGRELLLILQEQLTLIG